MTPAMPLAARLRRVPVRDERGSISLFAIVAVVAILVVLGLVVDGGARIRALQHADDTAREAARAGGEALQAAPAIRGEAALGDTSAGRRAAQNYLAGAGVSGSVSVSGDRIVVNTTTTVDPIFLGLIGIGAGTAHGHAEARIVRALNGVER